MSPENPERLWAFTCDGTRGIRSIVATTDGQGADVHASMTRSATKPAEYVRADIASAEKAAAEAKYKDRDVEVMRVALADLRRIRACFVARANSLRTISEEDRAKGLEDAIKQLDEEVFT